jgi:hypothetical protein
MKTRKIPVADHPATGPKRVWTEKTIPEADLISLLGMPDGTRLISMRRQDGDVVITAEEPRESPCSDC